jgi:hypothetical protein
MTQPWKILASRAFYIFVSHEIWRVKVGYNGKNVYLSTEPTILNYD